MSDNKRLFKSLSSADAQSGACYIVDVSNLENVAAAVDRLEKDSQAAGLKTVQVDLRPFKTFSDLMSVLQLHADEGINVVNLVNGDKWFKEGKDLFNGTLIGRLEFFNIVREHFFKAGVQKILWLQPETISAIATQCPDVWAWRSGVYALSDKAAPAAPKKPQP